MKPTVVVAAMALIAAACQRSPESDKPNTGTSAPEAAGASRPAPPEVKPVARLALDIQEAPSTPPTSIVVVVLTDETGARRHVDVGTSGLCTDATGTRSARADALLAVDCLILEPDGSVDKRARYQLVQVSRELVVLRAWLTDKERPGYEEIRRIPLPHDATIQLETPAEGTRP